MQRHRRQRQPTGEDKPVKEEDAVIFSIQISKSLFKFTFRFFDAFSTNRQFIYFLLLFV